MSELKRGLFPRRNKGEPQVADTSASTNVDGANLDGANLDGDGTSQSATPPEVKKSRFNGSVKRRLKKRNKKKRRRLTLAVLPTMLTLGNAVCGLAAIAIAVSTDFPWPEYQLFVAAVLIFGGMLFDALDGSAARMTGQESRFGAELDSLCDAVTFGVAPAVIIWQMNEVLLQRYTWGIGALFTLCVLIRLARFNVETDEDDTHEGFEGLPSPAAAGTIAAFAIAIPELKSIAANVDAVYHTGIQSFAQHVDHASHFFIPAIALVLAYLMVSRYQYPHIVQQWVSGRRPLNQIGQALFVVFGVVVLHSLALPVILTYFAFASPTRALLGKLRQTPSGESPSATPP